MLRHFFGLFVFALTATAADAAGVNLDLLISFDARKVQHDCVDNASGSGATNPGPGNCGLWYQAVDFDFEYSGSLVLSGEFFTSDGVTYEADNGSFACVIGGFTCAARTFQIAEISASSASVSLTGLSLSSEFGFDFLTGSGTHYWEDDDMPFFAVGRFELTNARVIGLPIAPVPLPASMGFLAAGLMGFGFLRTVQRLR